MSIPGWADLPDGVTEDQARDILGPAADDPLAWSCPAEIGAAESGAAYRIRRELARRRRDGVPQPRRPAGREN